MSKLKTCPDCGHEVSSSAKKCPNCGKKLKHPFRTFLIIIAVLFALFIIIPVTDTSTTDATEATETTVTYIEVSVKQMQDDLAANALKAKNTYEGNYVEVTGYLQNIDADGSYISISSESELTLLENTIMCYINSDTVRSNVATLSKQTKITVRGLVTNVDEVWGYTIKNITIK